MDSLQLTFQPSEKLPQPGETVIMQGLVQRYAVTIHQVLRKDELDNGLIRLSVRATKRPIEEPQS